VTVLLSDAKPAAGRSLPRRLTRRSLPHPEQVSLRFLAAHVRQSPLPSSGRSRPQEEQCG
jgi:hypothetical protein